MMTASNERQKAFSVDCTVNGAAETIRFSPYALRSERMAFELDQTYGLDTEGKLSQQFESFAESSTEALLLSCLKSGDVDALKTAGLVLYERPKKGDISRNLSVYDPKTGLSFTLGGVGLIRPEQDDETAFVLDNPMLDKEFGAYQKARGQNEGGTRLVTEEGFKSITNRSVVGVVAYDSGPYNIVRKVTETERMHALGITTPQFIAAGRILNLAEGQYGFSIYRSALTPEYMLNLSLYLDQNAQFKKNYQVFLESKYQQLAKMHREIGESHGQPSVTNTLSQIDVSTTSDNLCCQIKDFQTNQPIPRNTQKIIEDGLCPVKLPFSVKKSPHVAAMIYDLQHALTQELNILFMPTRFIKQPQEKFNYIANQSARLLRVVANSYGVGSEKAAQEAIDFAVHRYFDAIKQGVPMDRYNEMIAGLFVHKLFALSADYAAQIDITG